jgi:hypothetical protein
VYRTGILKKTPPSIHFQLWILGFVTRDLSWRSVSVHSLHVTADAVILSICMTCPQITQRISIKPGMETEEAKHVSKCQDRSNILFTSYKDQLEICRVVFTFWYVEPGNVVQVDRRCLFSLLFNHEYWSNNTARHEHTKDDI